MPFDLPHIALILLGLSICGFPLVLLRLWTCRQARRRFGAHAVLQRHPTKLEDQSSAKRPLKVVFLHPDLGIGGAERLVVDAAIALQGYQKVTPVNVIVVTSHHDPNRAFAETVDGRVTVHVYGSWLPTSIMGRAKVFVATLRMCWAAFVACCQHSDADCFMVDQVAAVLPLLSFVAPHIPRLFYCHFPDQCCDGNRDENQQYKRPPSTCRVLYRRFFDEVEARAMDLASSIVSNSRFSRAVTVKLFPKLTSKIDVEADIFYPPVSLAVREGAEAGGVGKASDMEQLKPLRSVVQGRSVVLSINRYERKKNLVLAVRAFAHAMNSGEISCTDLPLLVVAGGYDTRLEENVSHLEELQQVAMEHDLNSNQIVFLRNITEMEKRYLLSQCCCLLYTPTAEHFGIVPTEAMVNGKPVIAVNHGGPCESVGEGGVLCDPTPEAFAQAIVRYLNDEQLRERTGEAGKKRASEVFSIETFGEKLAARLVKLWAEANAAMGEAASLKEGLEGGKKSR